MFFVCGQCTTMPGKRKAHETDATTEGWREGHMRGDRGDGCSAAVDQLLQAARDLEADNKRRIQGVQQPAGPRRAPVKARAPLGARRPASSPPAPQPPGAPQLGTQAAVDAEGDAVMVPAMSGGGGPRQAGKRTRRRRGSKHTKHPSTRRRRTRRKRSRRRRTRHKRARRRRTRRRG